MSVIKKGSVCPGLDQNHDRALASPKHHQITNKTPQETVSLTRPNADKGRVWGPRQATEVRVDEYPSLRGIPTTRTMAMRRDPSVPGTMTG